MLSNLSKPMWQPTDSCKDYIRAKARKYLISILGYPREGDRQKCYVCTNSRVAPVFNAINDSVASGFYVDITMFIPASMVKPKYLMDKGVAETIEQVGKEARKKEGTCVAAVATVATSASPASPARTATAATTILELLGKL